jgi:receptor protein-tyrosine kinase
MSSDGERRYHPQILSTGPDHRPGSRELIRRSAIAAEVQAIHAPQSPQVDALRKIVARLLFWRSHRPPRLAVVSTDPGDGRTFMTANLAVLLAQAGKRVLLVDADLRGGRVHTLFGCDAAPGLSDLLPGDADWRVVRAVENVPGLHVLPGGSRRDTPLDFLTSTSFAEALDSLQPAFDMILLDTPAQSAHMDAEVIAAQAGGALLVVYRDRTLLRQARHLADSLTAAGVEVVGSVLNNGA